MYLIKRNDSFESKITNRLEISFVKINSEYG